MLRVLSLATVLVAALAVSVDAQIISNPVLTTWTPHAHTVVARYPVATPVVPGGIAPPIVTIGDPYVPTPVTVHYMPSAVAPVFPWVPVPRTTAYTVTSVPPTIVYQASPMVVYRPVVAYRVPTVAYRVPAIPVTTYYAPAMPVTTVYSPPVAAPAGCGCR